MVQSLTPFRHVGRGSPSPLEGVASLTDVASKAAVVGMDPCVVEKLLDATGRLFNGRLWAYHPVDLRYHDLSHTAQAAFTYLSMVEGHARVGRRSVQETEYMVGFAGILLHDTGFLRVVGDDVGTGAKYTHSHVLRSCALAASLLPTFGFSRQQVEDAVGMIRCTGLTGKPDAGTFSTETAREVARMVATADYIGQMAAVDYPVKLRYLFAEFEEADDFSGVPAEKRMFKSSKHLLSATRGFWQGFVLPKLDKDFGGVYHYLSEKEPTADNSYVRAILHNLDRIEANLATER